MKLYIDFLQKGKKSKYKIFLGITFVILGITYFISKIYLESTSEFGSVGVIDYLFLLFFIFLGIVFIFRGIGNPLESKIGKAFISVDEQNICIKKSIIGKEVVYSWDKIESVHFGTNRFFINDDEILTDPEKITNEEFLKLRSLVNQIMLSKGIEIED